MTRTSGGSSAASFLKTAATVPRLTCSSAARSSIGGSWVSAGYVPLAILCRISRSTRSLGSSGSLPGTLEVFHDHSNDCREYSLDIECIAYNAYEMRSWDDQQLAILRPQYSGWDLWAVRGIYPKPHTVWCARPRGHPVATINVGSPEALVAEIAKQEGKL